MRRIFKFFWQSPILLVLFGYLSLGIYYIDFSPVYDGAAYLDYLTQAIQTPSQVKNFDWAGHPTWVFSLLLALPQFISPGNGPLLNMTLVFLGMCALFGFESILRRVFPGKGNIEYALVTTLLAVHPKFFAHNLYINSDFAVLIFSILYVAALLSHRSVLIMLTGIGLVFSKETGMAFYAAMTGFYLIVFVSRKYFIQSITRREALTRALSSIVPGIAVLIYISMHLMLKVPLFWSKKQLFDPWCLLSFEISEKWIIDELFLIFVFNFSWIFTVGMSCLVFKRLFLWAFPIRGQTFLTSPENYFFILCAFWIILYTCTRFRFDLVARYFLALIPFMIIIFYNSILEFFPSPPIRKCILSLLCLLLFFAGNASFDPITRALTPTFAFGRHSVFLFANPKIQGSFEGTNDQALDSLVYNRQYMALHYLLNEFFKRTKPQPNTSLSLATVHAHYLNYELEIQRGNFERSLRSSMTFRPQWICAQDIPICAQNIRLRIVQPNEAFYLALPNVDNASDLAIFRNVYKHVQSEIIDFQGYTAILYTFSDPQWADASES